MKKIDNNSQSENKNSSQQQITEPIVDTTINNKINGGAHKNKNNNSSDESDEEPLHIPAKPAFAGGASALQQQSANRDAVDSATALQQQSANNSDNKPEEHEETKQHEETGALTETSNETSTNVTQENTTETQGGKKSQKKHKKDSTTRTHHKNGGLGLTISQEDNNEQKTESQPPINTEETTKQGEEKNMLSLNYLQKIKSHKCNCIFWRDKGVSDFTCLIESEIKKLQQLTPLKIPTKDNTAAGVSEWYKNLVQQLGCQNSQDWDRCVLAKQFKNNPEVLQIYSNAIPTVQKEYRDQWLTSFDVDRLLYGLEQNMPIYKYMGIACWDEFEDQTTNLNINYIIQTIKENPNKKVLGWVLNQCHKFSPGKHWVAMTFVKNDKTNKYKVYYYDSQGYNGPQNEKIIDCDMRIDETNPNYQKYLHYKSHFEEWWQQLLTHHDIIENHRLPLFNNFETQGDNYSCGYHAVFFNFLCAKFTQSHKNFTPNALALKILGNVRDTELGKALNEYIQLFQDHCTISG